MVLGNSHFFNRYHVHRHMIAMKKIAINNPTNYFKMRLTMAYGCIPTNRRIRRWSSTTEQQAWVMLTISERQSQVQQQPRPRVTLSSSSKGTRLWKTFASRSNKRTPSSASNSNKHNELSTPSRSCHLVRALSLPHRLRQQSSALSLRMRASVVLRRPTTMPSRLCCLRRRAQAQLSHALVRKSTKQPPLHGVKSASETHWQ